MLFTACSLTYPMQYIFAYIFADLTFKNRRSPLDFLTVLYVSFVVL